MITTLHHHRVTGRDSGNNFGGFSVSYFEGRISYVHQKKEAVCALRLPVTGQGSTSPLTNPHCFTSYTFCDVTSHLSSLKGGGASDSKNPDPYYSTRLVFLLNVSHLFSPKVLNFNLSRSGQG